MPKLRSHARFGAFLLTIVFVPGYGGHLFNVRMLLKHMSSDNLSREHMACEHASYKHMSQAIQRHASIILLPKERSSSGRRQNMLYPIKLQLPTEYR